MPTSLDILRRDGLPDGAELGLSGQPAELRKAGDGARMLVGYAAVFNSMSHDLGGFREIIRPGAFAQSLEESPDVAARIQHAGGLSTIGRTTNGTLRLKEDDFGLRYEVDLPPTTAGNDIAILVERGDISKSSFAFTLRDDGETEPQRWHFDQDPAMRELFNLNLHDVAPVDGPAYEATSVMVRDGAEDKITAAKLAEERRLHARVAEENAALYRQQYGLEDVI